MSKKLPRELYFDNDYIREAKSYIDYDNLLYGNIENANISGTHIVSKTTTQIAEGVYRIAPEIENNKN